MVEGVVMFQSSRLKSVVLSIISLVLLMGIGCTRLAPKSTGLRNIHNTYRNEFDQYLRLGIPAAADSREETIKRINSASIDLTRQAAFSETLREIRYYRVMHGESTREAAHLTVLEGMIYLQTGQFSLASLLVPEIKKAEALLSENSGSMARDRLFAATFEALINGWGAISRSERRISNLLSRSAATPIATVPLYLQLANASTTIGKELETLRSNKKVIYQPEVDDGAIYLATTAAIFYLHVGEVMLFKYPDESMKQQRQEEIACWCEKGRLLMAPFLSDSEKRIAEGVDSVSAPPGRLRYLGWYKYLTGCAGKSPVTTCQAVLPSNSQ